ncbi:MAG TPA: hypothetical protein VI685_23115, partial [Candidatus Angelobacter sp.]
MLRPKEMSKVEVVFGNEKNSPLTLEALSFEISVTSTTLAEASYSANQEYDVVFKAECFAQGCRIGTLGDSSAEGKLFFGPEATMTIRVTNQNNEAKVLHFDDVEELHLAIAPRVGFLVLSSGLELSGIDSAVIEPQEFPGFRPEKADTLLWRNRLLNTHGDRIRTLDLRPADGRDVAVRVAAGPGDNTTTVIATSNGIARVGVNDVQALPGQLAYEITHGPYRFSRQDVASGKREATFAIFEKSKELDLTGISVSSPSSDITIRFRELSLYPILTEFSLDRWDYLHNLDKKYRTMGSYATL